MPIMILILYVFGAMYGYHYVDDHYYHRAMPFWPSLGYWAAAIVLMFLVGIVYLMVTEKSRHHARCEEALRHGMQTELDRQHRLEDLARTPNPGVSAERRRTFELRKRQARHKRRVSGVNN